MHTLPKLIFWFGAILLPYHSISASLIELSERADALRKSYEETCKSESPNQFIANLTQKFLVQTERLQFEIAQELALIEKKISEVRLVIPTNTEATQKIEFAKIELEQAVNSLNELQKKDATQLDSSSRKNLRLEIAKARGRVRKLKNNFDQTKNLATQNISTKSLSDEKIKNPANSIQEKLQSEKTKLLTLGIAVDTLQKKIQGCYTMASGETAPPINPELAPATTGISSK